MDLSFLVNQIKATDQGLRLRQGKVITVNANQTIDVQIAGDTNTLPSIKYVSNYAPKPDDQVWLLNNGVDILGFGMVAGTSRTLSPKAYRTALQSIPSATDTLVTFQAVENDDWNCWDASPNPTRLTAPVTGRYMAQAQLKWSDGASGVRRVSIKKNGTQEIAYADAQKATGHGAHTSVTSPPFTMTKNDYIETIAYSEASLDLIITANGDNYTGWFPSMSLIYLGS